MTDSRPRAAWLPAAAAGGVLVAVLAAGFASSGSNGSAQPTPTASTSASTDGGETSLTVPPITEPNVVLESTDVPVVKTAIAGPLGKGSSGDDVKKVQQRLKDLGFAPGKIDGYFGSGTQQAVWAYKKLVGGLTYQDLAASKDPTIVSPDLWQTMQDPIVIQPRRPGTGTHAEVYLPLQVMAIFTDNTPTLIAHISTGQLDEMGKPKQWCDTTSYNTDNEGQPLDPPVVRQECAYAKTPGGVFRFRRKVAGNREGPLGGMYNPVYFNYGLAVHGAKNVPKEPASHGCVRINMDIAEYFPSLVHVGDRVFVWGHDGKEPEQYSHSESLPSFNAPDPNATTTTSTSTSSTTTTVKATTTVKSSTTDKAPTTTVKATTTTRPATTAATTTTTAAPTTTG